MELDLSLENKEIYLGIKIESFGGRKSFELNQDNLNLIGDNISEHVKNIRRRFKDGSADIKDKDSVVLTGATAIPVYLVAFHVVVHNFHEVRFKNEMLEVIVAKH
ncbi:MAG: hypothetical protein EVG15_01095 [Candidatus Acididesulfobacter diazotrophicus]|jgi:hypothetical protein|uniref:Uncharacterized protein n=1 Tax=Candidatus Acididesulfobacter diazotrophicus TaxID=2597226 RepID=A0A519BQM0_9DELT|nr:MAG: hypothetical protein EVG15_01095 [Candidatus Acididesulfobacter diazotrophicus]